MPNTSVGARDSWSLEFRWANRHQSNNYASTAKITIETSNMKETWHHSFL